MHLNPIEFIVCLPFVALIYIGFRVLLWLFGSKPTIDPTLDALDILNTRLARGEISEDDYRRLKATIEQ